MQKPQVLNIKNLVLKIPEVYHPVYGHPEFNCLVSRCNDDRLRDIKAVHNALARKLGRQVRVLDLGCAQGWVSLQIAEAGATVLGIDHFQPNIDVCNALASENISLSVRFERGDIQEIPRRLEAGQIDLLLGLSVFHHLCHSFGKEWVCELIGNYIDKTSMAILELALSSEHPDWSKSLPDDPGYFLKDIEFVSVLSKHVTHLSSMRPLYVCSRKFRYENGIVIETGDSVIPKADD